MINAYDQMPYQGHSYAHTHPGVMATVATLRGLSPAPVTTCRVLEVGCAEGYNLLPMAMGLPQAQFVGIDYSPVQINLAREFVDELKVANVRFHTLNILDWDEDLGQFDYIIAHGVYSWVPADVRDGLLAGMRRSLTPQGVACVSFNTYPGWHMLEALRHMMRYHGRTEDSPQGRAQKGREMIELLISLGDVSHLPHAAFLPAYQHVVQNYYHTIMKEGLRTDSHLLHDELEEVNDPCYFHQFVEHIHQHGLDYVGDTEFSSMIAQGLPEETMNKLRGVIRSSHEMEQYLDFVRNRTFRHALLCHQGQSLAAHMTAPALAKFRFRAETRPDLENLPDGAKRPTEEELTGEDLTGEARLSAPEVAAVKFVAMDGAAITTDHPVSIVALNRMGRTYPRSYSLDELLDLAYRELGESNPHMADSLQQAAQGQDAAKRSEDGTVLTRTLVSAYSSSSRLVEFVLPGPVVATRIHPRPAVFAWARWQARTRETVSTPFLRRVQLDAFTRFLLVRMDGSRSRADLIQAVLDGPVKDGLWQMAVADLEDQSPESLARAVARSVDQGLDFLLRAGLLVQPPHSEEEAVNADDTHG
jgi:SAM-dependent methyltransferase